MATLNRKTWQEINDFEQKICTDKECNEFAEESKEFADELKKLTPEKYFKDGKLSGCEVIVARYYYIDTEDSFKDKFDYYIANSYDLEGTGYKSAFILPRIKTKIHKKDENILSDEQVKIPVTGKGGKKSDKADVDITNPPQPNTTVIYPEKQTSILQQPTSSEQKSTLNHEQIPTPKQTDESKKKPARVRTDREIERDENIKKVNSLYKQRTASIVFSDKNFKDLISIYFNFLLSRNRDIEHNRGVMGIEQKKLSITKNIKWQSERINQLLEEHKYLGDILKSINLSININEIVKSNKEVKLKDFNDKVKKYKTEHGKSDSIEVNGAGNISISELRYNILRYQGGRRLSEEYKSLYDQCEQTKRKHNEEQQKLQNIYSEKVSSFVNKCYELQVKKYAEVKKIYDTLCKRYNQLTSSRHPAKNRKNLEEYIKQLDDYGQAVFDHNESRKNEAIATLTKTFETDSDLFGSKKLGNILETIRVPKTIESYTVKNDAKGLLRIETIKELRSIRKISIPDNKYEKELTHAKEKLRKKESELREHERDSNTPIFDIVNNILKQDTSIRESQAIKNMYPELKDMINSIETNAYLKKSNNVNSEYRELREKTVHNKDAITDELFDTIHSLIQNVNSLIEYKRYDEKQKREQSNLLANINALYKGIKRVSSTLDNEKKEVTADDISTLVNQSFNGKVDVDKLPQYEEFLSVFKKCLWNDYSTVRRSVHKQDDKETLIWYKNKLSRLYNNAKKKAQEEVNDAKREIRRRYARPLVADMIAKKRQQRLETKTGGKLNINVKGRVSVSSIVNTSRKNKKFPFLGTSSVLYEKELDELGIDKLIELETKKINTTKEEKEAISGQQNIIYMDKTKDTSPNQKTSIIGKKTTKGGESKARGFVIAEYPEIQSTEKQNTEKQTADEPNIIIDALQTKLSVNYMEKEQEEETQNGGFVIQKVKVFNVYAVATKYFKERAKEIFDAIENQGNETASKSPFSDIGGKDYTEEAYEKLADIYRACYEAARFFQILVSGTPMDENYGTKFGDEEDAKTITHEPDSDIVRADWILHFRGEDFKAFESDNDAVFSGNMFFKKENFYIQDDEQATKEIATEIFYQTTPLKEEIIENIKAGRAIDNDTNKYTVENINTRWKMLEYGGYVDKEGKPLTTSKKAGERYLHGLTKGYTYQAPRGFLAYAYAFREVGFGATHKSWYPEKTLLRKMYGNFLPQLNDQGKQYKKFNISDDTSEGMKILSRYIYKEELQQVQALKDYIKKNYPDVYKAQTETPEKEKVFTEQINNVILQIGEDEDFVKTIMAKTPKQTTKKA